MSKVVSKEEMSALMNATAPKNQADSKRISGYDFKHPFLISREQLRFISTMHEGLARKFTDYLSEKSNSSISVSIGSSDQIQFWEFIKSLKTPATIFHGTIKLPEAKIMVDFDTKLALVLVDKILGGTGEVDEEKTKLSDIENLGAEFYGSVKGKKGAEYFLNSDTIVGNNENFLGHFLHGLKLKSYEFKKYKTKKEANIISINVIGNKNKPSVLNQLKFKSLDNCLSSKKSKNLKFSYSFGYATKLRFNKSLDLFFSGTPAL